MHLLTNTITSTETPIAVYFDNAKMTRFESERLELEPRPFYLHHEDHRVERDHDKHRVLKRGRGHKMPQPVLEGLPVLGHVAGHGLGADGEVNAGSLAAGGKSQTQDLRTTAKV